MIFYSIGGDEMVVREAVINRINEICDDKGMAVNKLANLSGITPSTVYSVFDSERKDIGIVLIKKICDGFDITLEEFFSSELFKTLEQELV
jgi:DNA-binding Xre family transcriptional regulator